MVLFITSTMSFKSKIYKLFNIKKTKKVNNTSLIQENMNFIINTCNDAKNISEKKIINRKKLIVTDYVSMGRIVYNNNNNNETKKLWLDNHDDYVLPPENYAKN
jgi:hypothetical protein